MEKLQEGLQITLRGSHRSQILPHREPRKSVVRFGLHEQALCVRDVNQRCQRCLVTRSFLVLRGARRLQFHRSILGYVASPFERSLGLPQLPGQVLQGLIVASRLGVFICRFNRLSRADPEDVQ